MGGKADGLEDIPALFTRGRDKAPNASEGVSASVRTKAAGDFLFTLDDPWPGFVKNPPHLRLIPILNKVSNNRVMRLRRKAWRAKQVVRKS